MLRFLSIISIIQIHTFCAGNLTNVTVRVNDFVSNDFSLYQDTNNFANLTVLREQNLKNLTSYMGLVLINTTIDSLEENDIADLPNLRQLNIASAGIRQMSPGCFANLPELKYLVLSRNNLSELRRGIFDGLQIVLLDLRDNVVEKIEAGTFDNTTQLFELDLSRNNISQIDAQWFRGLASLDVLILSENKIAVLPNYAFKYLESLRYLYLERNQIGNLEEHCFRGLQDLRILDLSFNNILYLREDMFADQEKILEQLFLCGNMFKCNNMRRLTAFLTNLSSVTVEVTDCRCLRPVPRRKKLRKPRAWSTLDYLRNATCHIHLKKFDMIKHDC